MLITVDDEAVTVVTPVTIVTQPALAFRDAPSRNRVRDILLGLLGKVEKQNICTYFLLVLKSPAAVFQFAILGAEIIFQIDEASPLSTYRTFRYHSDCGYSLRS
jgi:hypothetical protein